jgi:hypothetical protein
MATSLRSNLRPILLLLQQQLMTWLDLPLERVLIDARREMVGKEVHLQADWYVRVRVLGQSPDLACWEGAGRVQLPMRRRIKVVLWSRLLTDVINQDALLLTDASLSHLDREDLIVDALAGWWPTDSDNNVLTRVPLQPGPEEEPERNDTADGWARSAVEFTIDRVEGLLQPDPFAG